MPVQPWKSWGQRIRVHMREKKLRPVNVAASLEMSDSALRSWLNGTRQINLSDFFRLCDVVKADPRQMLFGSPGLSPEQRQALGEAVANLLENDTAVHPNYPQLVQRLQKDLTSRKSKR